MSRILGRVGGSWRTSTRLRADFGEFHLDRFPGGLSVFYARAYWSVTERISERNERIYARADVSVIRVDFGGFPSVFERIYARAYLSVSERNWAD